MDRYFKNEDEEVKKIFELENDKKVYEQFVSIGNDVLRDLYKCHSITSKLKYIVANFHFPA
jgi:hypothetical protein